MIKGEPKTIDVLKLRSPVHESRDPLSLSQRVILLGLVLNLYLSMNANQRAFWNITYYYCIYLPREHKIHYKQKLPSQRNSRQDL